MSHSRQRKDKVCLNCASEIYGRYCHRCGQENIEPKETAWQLITHFLYDITHFDGKFFSTVKYLLLRPGFLSREYVKGRRASYLHPIRMYVFTSAFFFIIFFSMVRFEMPDIEESDKAGIDSLSNVLKGATNEAGKDSTLKAASAGIRRFEIRDDAISGEKRSDRKKTSVSVRGVAYDDVAAYDSAQLALPAAQRDGWYKRWKTRKLTGFSSKLNDDPRGFFQNWIDKLLHSFPQLLFVSLPLFALLLKLLYFRRKEFYYGDHAIFTIHLYIFTFISLFLFIMSHELHKAMQWGWIKYIELAICMYVIYYTYRSLKNFYQQSHLKTFLKFCLLNAMSFIMIMFLFLFFVALSIYKL